MQPALYWIRKKKREISEAVLPFFEDLIFSLGSSDITDSTTAYSSIGTFPARKGQYLRGDGSTTTFTNVALAGKTLTYWDGTAEQTDTFDGSGIWTIPNAVTLGLSCPIETGKWPLKVEISTGVYEYYYVNEEKGAVLVAYNGDPSYNIAVGGTISGIRLPSQITPNIFNQVGGSIADGTTDYYDDGGSNLYTADAVIPLDSNGNIMCWDSLGARKSPEYTGKAQYNMTYHASTTNQNTITTSETITGSFTGLTVTETLGTAVLAVSGANIICSTGGTVIQITLSNGSIGLIDDSGLVQFTGGEIGTKTGTWTAGLNDTYATKRLTSGVSDALECVSAGVAYAEQTDAYGVFDFSFMKGSEINQIDIKIIGSNTGIHTTDSLSYFIQVSGSERVGLWKYTTSSIGVFYTASSYIEINKTYRLIVFRNSVLNEYVTGATGTWAVYIQGRSGYPITDGVFTSPDLTKMELVTPAVGNNPGLDNTHTTSSYTTKDLDVGDITKSFTVNGKEIEPATFATSNPTKFKKVYIPESTTAGIDTWGGSIKYPAVPLGVLQDVGVIGKMSTDTDLAYYNADVTYAGSTGYPFLTADNTAREINYSDLTENIGNANQYFWKLCNNTASLGFAYDEGKTNTETDLIIPHLICSALTYILDEDGNYIFDSYGSLITE